jgi:hypothetical protein
VGTALEGHPLAGYRPGKKPPTEDAFAGKVKAEGFSGFSHFTGEVIESEPAPALTTDGIPGFSGFGHATEAMGGNPPLVTAAVMKSSSVETEFSGFRHATQQMGGNPPIPKGTSIAPKKPAAINGAYLGSL